MFYYLKEHHTQKFRHKKNTGDSYKRDRIYKLCPQNCQTFEASTYGFQESVLLVGVDVVHVGQLVEEGVVKADGCVAPKLLRDV